MDWITRGGLLLLPSEFRGTNGDGEAGRRYESDEVLALFAAVMVGSYYAAELGLGVAENYNYTTASFELR
jgi:hypothetical protein